jgi:hypothetical protein
MELHMLLISSSKIKNYLYIFSWPTFFIDSDYHFHSMAQSRTIGDLAEEAQGTLNTNRPHSGPIEI